jgi:cytochrome c6
LRRVLLIVLLLIPLLTSTLIYPASAAETSDGAKIFSANCASCHIGGGNVLIAEKTLVHQALSKYLENYENNSISAIIYRVKNGKNAMPAFKGKLSDQEVLDVATYVAQKAQQGW